MKRVGRQEEQRRIRDGAPDGGGHDGNGRGQDAHIGVGVAAERAVVAVAVIVRLRALIAAAWHLQGQGGLARAFAGAEVHADALGVVTGRRQAQRMGQRRRQRRPQDRDERDPQGGAGQEGSGAHGARLYRSRSAFRLYQQVPAHVLSVDLAVAAAGHHLAAPCGPISA
ncbi:hypothetical protein D9M68_656340 [compost metagenome]